ncbi:MAG: discoidin domain-containing protein [Planctomycetota bacterium]|nr:discoidin domain-containing protein [Planctomycetota bacterium]
MMRYHEVVLVLAALLVAPGATGGEEPRKVISLDGPWEIGEGAMDKAPDKFESKVPVPGFADMAQPAFKNVGVKDADPLREAFWYRRTFSVGGPIPAVALLKVHKAEYTTRVYLNGQLVGEHLSSFTPGYFDLKPHLKPGDEKNELVIRVGASRKQVPPDLPDGFDFEKVRYIPGIYDSVELILSGTPHIVRVQVAPDIEKKEARVQAVVRWDGLQDARVSAAFTVREAKSKKEVGTANSGQLVSKDGIATPDVRIPIKDCHLWSPEDPFLYELEVNTGGDVYTTRFGMRSFRFNTETKRAELNGKTYFLRGTNTCFFRFAEDPARGGLPWREDWVRNVIRSWKSMHWNSARYCIGFPPEVWYRVADEEGLLVQDEYPIWYGGAGWAKARAGLKHEQIAGDYADWMQERWNHPCVVIWDAQNETSTQETGPAIHEVRGLDLSNRPWDNGYGTEDQPGDSFESHPYLFSNANFKLRQLAGVNPTPGGNARPNKGNNAIIINEYCWLWLNRDGTPTTLTKQVYKNLLGDNATPGQCRTLHARYVAALTEFWRCHRKCAGVLHFCSLSYSRAGGQTCDDYIDLEKLTIEPEFRKYVGDAFAPVGLMIDFWTDEPNGGEERQVPVVVINDLYQDWQGQVRFRMLKDGKAVQEKVENATVPALGDKRITFACAVPAETGSYQFEAALIKGDAPPVLSLRDFQVMGAEEKKARQGIAVGKPVKASSSIAKDGAANPEAAVDGNPATRWSSEFSDPQWLAVDLGKTETISRVELLWEGAYGKEYAIEVSADGENWKEVYTTDKGKAGTDSIKFAPTAARWVRMMGKKRGTEFGYSLYEMRVFP